MEKRFKREIKSLGKISNFISDFIARNGIDDSLTFTLNLALEELFTNMVKYNTQNTNEILISLNRDGNRLVVRLIDHDVEPFDMTARGEVDVEKRLEDRKPGGLGIHIVKKLVDKIEYEYRNRKSTVILIKMLEE